MNFIKKFIEDLGYKDYAYTDVSISTDKIGYYHLKIQNYEFKVDFELKTKEISFTPIKGVNISSKMVEFIEALRNSDTTKLIENIKSMKIVLYDTTKQVAYEDAKKEFAGVRWDEYKKGKVLVPFTYELYGNDVYDIIYDKTGEDLLGSFNIDIRGIEAIGEGVLRYWKEMTGREDLYVSDDIDGGFICSK